MSEFTSGTCQCLWCLAREEVRRDLRHQAPGAMFARERENALRVFGDANMICLCLRQGEIVRQRDKACPFHGRAEQ